MEKWCSSSVVVVDPFDIELDDCTVFKFSVGDSLELSGIQFTPPKTKQFCRVWRGDVN